VFHPICPHGSARHTLARLSLFQEARFGKEKMELVKILQHHHVVIRGSNEEGQQFVDALLVSKAFCSR
jgi:hypothetical protein